jgi:hypothetical protein
MFLFLKREKNRFRSVTSPAANCFGSSQKPDIGSLAFTSIDHEFFEKNTIVMRAAGWGMYRTMRAPGPASTRCIALAPTFRVHTNAGTELQDFSMR